MTSTNFRLWKKHNNIFESDSDVYKKVIGLSCQEKENIPHNAAKETFHYNMEHKNLPQTTLSIYSQQCTTVKKGGKEVFLLIIYGKKEI